MSSPRVNLPKALSTESLHLRNEASQHRLSLQHIFNSCVLDKHQRVNAGELIRHFRFVAEQNTDLVSAHLVFSRLLAVTPRVFALAQRSVQLCFSIGATRRRGPASDIRSTV